MSNKFKQKTDKELINLVITLITDHSYFINNWLEVIYNDKLQIPEEIKNRIFTIWIYGAIDTIRQEENQYLHLLGECKSRGFINNTQLLIQFGNLVESIKIQLRDISINSQIGIIQFRNSLVHGRICSVHHPKITIHVFDINTNQTNKLSFNNEDYWKIVNYEWQDSIDNFLTPMRKKFFKKDTRYYENLKTISQVNFAEKVTTIGYFDLN